ncbi:MAG: NAD(P)H-binding protein [Candidatus Cloacimonetes bacterium]|jgi:hypothetical protein|nr:NAD(P)H-binding protein [Candidatus Cloacimonadota bacterium]MBT4333560.1 NAD(P)H-binding protein [Candidatus Cloacimonadota bacterium]MBT4575699.1 NAD(P)H-binding protein [Candidatus Cloacimonadota bacterium]
MKTLVLGASGVTGKQLVEQLLKMGQDVKVVIRPTSEVADKWQTNKKVTVIKASISELTLEEIQSFLIDCNSVASCLGHNLTFKGMFGNPRKLVTDSVRLLCEAIETGSSQKPVKFVLMNTTAVRNKDLAELTSLGQKIVFSLIHLLLPPHRDNEAAADYLRLRIGQNNKFIEWVSIRPDTLINEDIVTEYQIYRSPIRSAVFDPGRTSRINVGNFMARLLMEPDLWKKWQGQMPVIYNNED